MSMAIKASKSNMRGAHAGAMYSRRAYMGDPGLFGFLGKAAGSILGVASKILPGPVGIAAGTIGGALIGSKSGSTTKNGTAVMQVPPPPGISGGPLSGGTWGGSIAINPPLMGAPGVGVSTHFGPMGGGTAVAPYNGNGGPAPSGYHYNKSDYFLKDGTYVPKGTRLVKNRRRNPLNPRAASRAISRLESAKKATKRLDRISVKCRRCGYTACRCKG